MWIRSQNGEELLEVKRIKSMQVDKNDTNILAGLDRETVILGIYNKDQADQVMEDLKESVGFRDALYTMPKRQEDEEDFEVDFEEVKTALVNASKFMRDFAEAAAKVKIEKGEQK